MYTALLKFNFILSSCGIGLSRILKYFTLNIFVSIVELTSVLILGKIVSLILRNDSYLTNNFSPSQIYAYTLIILIFFILRSYFLIFASDKIVNFGMEVNSTLKLKLSRIYFNQPYSEYSKIDKSRYIHRVSTWANQFGIQVFLSILRMSGIILVSLSIIGYLLFSNWQSLFLLILITGVFVFGYMLLVRQRIDNYGVSLNSSDELLNSAIYDLFDGYKQIRTSKRSSFFLNRIYLNATKFSRIYSQFQKYHSIPRNLVDLLIFLFITANFLYFYIFLNSLDGLIDVFASFGVASIRLIPLLSQFTGLSMELRLNSHIIDEITTALKIENRNISNVNLSTTNNSCDNDLLIYTNNLTFIHQNSAEPLIKNVNLSIRKGDKVLIIGKSGSGKTTLIDLFLGILEPTFGNIIFSEKYLDELYYIPQSPFIYTGTIAENISLNEGDENINYLKINSLIHELNLNGLPINNLSLANSVLLNRGEQISGGQKQRISIARALYSNKSILLMDEPTSALDSDLDTVVMDLLLNNPSLTVIIISHKPNHIELFNKIYEVKNQAILPFVKTKKLNSFKTDL